jgi:hypothetical protein
MTPRQYWIGWSLMAAGWLLTVLGLCWYLGGKLQAILEVMRGR